MEAKRLKNYINGQWVESEMDQRVEFKYRKFNTK